MARRDLRDKRIVLTGASSGIGRALAMEFARRGARLVLTARRRERLDSLADETRRLGAAAEVVAGDIVDAAVRQEAIARCVERFGGLDALVNNAGVGAFGPFAEADAERLRRIMEVNFFAVAETIRAAIPLLRSGATPIVVNISSVLGHRAIPNASEYCASKFALQGLSESLRAELQKDGIDLLVVSPGTTRTEFFGSVLEQRERPRHSGRGGATAESVARATARAMQCGRHEIIPSLSARMLWRLNRLAPRLADALIARFG